MCVVSAKATGSNRGDIVVVCETSQKPITISNEYGMFCEDLCDYKREKRMHKTLSLALGIFSAVVDKKDKKKKKVKK